MNRKSRKLVLVLIIALIFGIPTGLLVREYHREQLNRDLIAAIKANDIPAALVFLKAGADANAHDYSEDELISPTHRFRQLLRKLFDTNARTETIAHPTVLLVLLSYPEGMVEDKTILVQALLDHGAEVNAMDENGETALVKAAHHGLYGSLHILAERGGKGQFDEDMSAIAMHQAIEDDNVDAARILLDQNISVETRWDRMTLLMLASERGNKAMVQLFLERHADVNAIGYGETALSLAQGHKYQDIVTMLRGAGAK